ncbi:interleukin-4 [Gracilinanus agilis]|uniref:interleukin-4 n=1 Tax=Gracilinanus agilis TaxID=191870 RepID=UPI001CFEE589|nr:interleukin-4 [Gracilinanus agilis]
MGLTFQLISTLFYLLTCPSDAFYGPKKMCQYSVTEIIGIVNFLTPNKFSCSAMEVPDIFEDTKNSSTPKFPENSSCSQLVRTTNDFETLCKAATVLQEVSSNCTLGQLRTIRRNLKYLVNQTNCPVNETKNIKLQDFLSRLKTINQKIFSEI